MSDAFRSIERGLTEAIAHARGKGPATIHEIEVPEPDVRAIRARTGLSQAAFAAASGLRRPRCSTGNSAVAAPKARRASCSP